jgi:hypothetical protein
MAERPIPPSNEVSNYEAQRERKPSESSFGSDLIKGLGGGALAATIAVLAIYNAKDIVDFAKKNNPYVNSNEPTMADKPPSRMPQAVSQKQSSAVKVFRDTGGGYYYGSSGVKVRDEVVLTAGHSILAGENYDTGPPCGRLFTSSRFTPGTNRDKADGWVARYDDKTDFGVIKIEGNPAFDQIPKAQVTKRIPKRGSVVYFVNYQPADVSVDRYPSLGIAEAYKEDLPILTQPARYAGVVLGVDPYDKDIAVATGLRSYGPQQGLTKYLKRGGSGGAVFDRRGKIFGLSVSGYDDRLKTVSSINKKYNIRLQAPSFARVNVAFVQPTPPSLVTEYVKDLKGQNC